MRSDTHTRGPGGGDFGEGDLEALFHAAPVPDMRIDTAAVIGGARRTRTRRRVAAVSGVTALALVVGGAWLGLPGSRDRASTDPAAPTSTSASTAPVRTTLEGADMYLEGSRVPGVTYDLRLDPGAGADGSDRVSVAGGGHRTQVDLRADEVVGTAGVTRRLGPRDYVVVASTSVDGVTIQRRADDDLEGGSTTGWAELGHSGLRVFAVRFDRTVRAADVVGTLTYDGSAHRVLSALPDGRPGPAQSAPVPGHDAVLYVDEALGVIGAEGGVGGVSAPLTGTDDLVALSWGDGTAMRAAGVFPEGADAVSATARWSAPGGSGGEADAVIVTLSGGRRAWFAELPSPDLDRRATASLRWTDADGVIHGGGGDQRR
ncbi:hypothetical protein GCM10009633_32970 [Janibacter melonis]|uniref:hypothetical protein n=1 Tax=Janibacter melonis TaxID=262209 RepID=UPI001E3DEF5F|nr:hypothetical protein [Janibacter melonis]MCB5990917.1 hypothetical protein [Janibacter melonis]